MRNENRGKYLPPLELANEFECSELPGNFGISRFQRAMQDWMQEDTAWHDTVADRLPELSPGHGPERKGSSEVPRKSWVFNNWRRWKSK